jgi:L-asparaginase II
VSRIIIDINQTGDRPDEGYAFKIQHPDGTTRADVAAVLKVVIRNLEKEAEG